MAKMRAVYFNRHGGINALRYDYREVPRLEADEVLIRVKACALNHLDLWTLMGMPTLKIPLPHILGCDVAGQIVDIGSKVKGMPVNRPVIAAPGISCGKCKVCLSGWDSLCRYYRILGLQVDGGYAEYVKVPARNIIQVSRKRSFEEWASVPLVFLTAWHMLITRAKLQKKEKVLIHSAGSGVGSAAIQIARYVGAEIYTTVGSDEKVKKAKDIGAHHVIAHHKKDFFAEVTKITNGEGVDVVLEHIGPATFSSSLACLKKKGRLVTCGVTSGPTVSMDLRFLFARQLSVIGCYMGGIQELKQAIRLIKQKKLKPVVDKVFPLRRAGEALERMQSRNHFGKIILVP